MPRWSGAGEAVPPSATTVDSVAASPPSDEAGMIGPSVEGQCYSQHHAGASDFVTAGCAAVLVAILRDGRPRGRPPQDEVRGCWTRITRFGPHPLMSHVKLGGATTRLSTRSGEMSMRMIVQRWERSPETSVNILLFAGSRMSVFRLGLSRSEYGRRPRGRPHRMIGNSPCRGRAPAVARDLSFTGPCPGAWLPENGLNVPSCSLCRALLPGRTAGRGDLAIDGPDEAGEFTGEDRKS